MEFSELLQQKTAEAEAAVRACLPFTEGPQKTVLDAMRYAVEAGGKRIRPILMMESFRLLCGDKRREQELYPVLGAFMGAMEMIHTFSLCHDDLPCMDNDRYRRGQLSVWAKYGEDMGTLAGDALSLYAFEVPLAVWHKTEQKMRTLGEAAADDGLQERLYLYQSAVLRALSLLAEKSGISGMLGGQVVDVEMTGKPLTQEQLMFVYRLKTGALLEASMMIGAVLAGADDAEILALSRIAEHIGVAFQIQDDILDETSTQEVLGKPIHSDEENQKTTYVSLHGLEEAGRKVEQLSAEALRELDALAVKGDRYFLQALVKDLIHREK